ncbi:U3 small nucleolar RNA-associated protein 4 homolog isoform X2 [Hyperolius riggenbachi]|uniref:U3 small nucleolar RNA-associated protein 4 homolog isoform X2 n=1 Tax=Hyperolius riggenbachi TaxID=752182 RepID=UPI0035A355B8
MGEYKVHRVRFFDYVPSGVRCIAHSEQTERLAVARTDGSVEVFNFPANYYQEKVIPGDERRSTESICWVGTDRLFSAGLNGEIVEYDLEKLGVKYSIDAFGGPLWSIAASPSGSQLAVACEDGSVKLFSITPERIVFEKSLDRQKGRILSLAWHPSGSHIVAGSVNVIKVFNVSSGRLLQVLKLDRRLLTGQKRECVPWALAVLSCGEIISVDSSGKLQFWDLETGTLFRSFTAASCAILCLAVSTDEDSLVVGTAQGTIFQYQLIDVQEGKAEKKWVCTKPFQHHTHDVRAVAHSSNSLISGGVDGHIVARPLLEKIQVKSYEAALRKITFPHRHLVSCAQASGLLLFQFPEHLELWRLGHTNQSGKDGDILPIEQEPELLLQLKKGPEAIRCSCISRCGSWMSYATSSSLYLHQLNYENNNISLRRVSKVPQPPGGALQLLFSPDSTRLYAGSERGSIHILELSGGSCSLKDTLQPPAASSHPVHLLAASKDGSLLAAASANSQIDVYNVKDMKYVCSVPQYNSPPTAIRIHPSTNNLVIAHADQHVVEFDIAHKQYTDWSRKVLQHGLHRDWLERDTPITGISFNPSRPEHILLHDNYMFCVLDKSQPLPDDNTFLLANQKALKHLSVRARRSRTHAFKITRKYQPLLFMDLLENGELVLVERPISDILAQLPPPIKQKKFGT